jgi:hypothetical protein
MDDDRQVVGVRLTKQANNLGEQKNSDYRDLPI